MTRHAVFPIEYAGITDPDLWDRLECFRFDARIDADGELRIPHDPNATFSHKLATDNCWTPSYTASVLAEYRRFLYLTQVSTSQVTPSEVIDQAWHMHLTYSREYWDALCGGVLGRALHHDAGTGPGDADRHRRQYDRTRALYRREFGVDPPRSIWQDAEDVRLWRSGRRQRGVGSGLLLAGCLAPFLMHDPVFGLFAGGLCILMGIVCRRHGRALMRDHGPEPRRRRLFWYGDGGYGACDGSGATADAGGGGSDGGGGCGGGGCGG